MATDRHVVEEMEALRASPEWKLRAQLEQLTFVFSLHHANYQELKRLMKAIAADEETILRLWNVQNRTVLDNVIEEASRLFFNFLSSANALVDHTRVHVRKLYSSSPFKEEYEAQKEQRLTKIPLRRFVQELRNYSLHQRIPIVTATLNLKPGQPPKNRLMLDISELARRHRWDAGLKKYMATLDEDHPLEDLVDDYMTLITSFYEWLGARESAIHRTALGELQQRENRLFALERQLWGEDDGSPHADAAPPK